MKEINFRMLNADEIEVRVQSVKNGKATMLLYMNSRVVTDLLDETVGNMNWCSEFQSVDGKVICRIGIWDEDKGMFIYKSDTGSESNIEAEKGQFSDCYKRCLSRWGVNELYTAPNIVIDDDGYGNRGYYVKYIRYADMDRRIIELHIANKFDKVVFSWKFGDTPIFNKTVPTLNTNTEEIVNQPQPYDMLVEFCKQAKADGADQEQLRKFFKYYEEKTKTWNGKFDAKSLWDKWNERAKKPRPIPQNHNDMSIQDYEERTLGADDQSFYY